MLRNILRVGRLSASQNNLSMPPGMCIVPSRTKYYHNRHRDPKYIKERRRKVWPVDLPDFDAMRKDDKDMSPDEVRSKLKEKGIAPPGPWSETEIYSACTMTVIEPYEPKQDENSSSLIDKLKSPLSAGKNLFKTKREESAVKAYEGDEFDLDTFASDATQIYIKAHEALAAKDESKIFDYVTEFCFPVMTAGLDRHTIHWKYIDDVEPPRAVQIRSGDIVDKGNKYSQITVRMHTKQMLAVYDRHGRLIHGSPTSVREILEYVVFEKYLANEYGQWRIHARIKQT